MSTCKPMNVSGKVMDEQTDTLRTAYDMCNQDRCRPIESYCSHRHEGISGAVRRTRHASMQSIPEG